MLARWHNSSHVSTTDWQRPSMNLSEAVRLGLERLIDRCRRDEIGRNIARGYRELPQDEAEVAWADESTARMIADEPW